jgi:hypothetical protein
MLIIFYGQWVLLRELQMKNLKLFPLVASALFLLASKMPAETPPIQWIIKEGHEVNRLKAERLYLEACRWVEIRHGLPEQKLRPPLVIHVGETCPDSKIDGACLSSLQGELYLPKWDETAPGYVLQAVLKASLLELLSSDELKDVAEALLTDDLRTYLDVRPEAQVQ